MKRHRLHSYVGLSWPVIIFFAALGVPHAIGRDFDITGTSFYVNAFLTLAPLVFWVWYIIKKDVPKAFYTLVAIGIVYGIMLGVIHNLAWSHLFGGELPAAGLVGNFVTRVTSFVSSVISGAFTGAVLGAITVFLKYTNGEIAKGR